jgi:hypothetical protein
VRLLCRVFGHAWYGTDPVFPPNAHLMASVPSWLVYYRTKTCRRCGVVEPIKGLPAH